MKREGKTATERNGGVFVVEKSLCFVICPQDKVQSQRVPVTQAGRALSKRRESRTDSKVVGN